MSNYRFILEPYKTKSSRYTCPSCGKPNQLTRYLDKESGQYLDDNVGICNRKTKCGYHYPPKQYFQDNNETNINKPPIASCSKTNNQTNQPNNTVLPFRGDVRRTEGSEEPPDYIDQHIYTNSQSNYDNNNLIAYLDTIFDTETVDILVNIYKIGTSSRYNGGSTIFWQIDTAGNIRTGKIIKYDPITGKRIKKPYVATNWIHSTEYEKGFNLTQCLFGEHLLIEDLNAPVAIVESEKTAIIAQAKMPDFLWLATGSLNEFKAKKLNVLKDRKVIAFPDIGAYDYWQKKASILEFNINVSDYLEKNATDQQKNEGLDIADFLTS